MHYDNVSEWAESRYPLYAPGSVQSLYVASDKPVHIIEENLILLIAVSSGKGILEAGERKYELAEGSLVLLPAHTRIALIAGKHRPLHAYKLTLRFLTQEGFPPEGGALRKSGLASGPEFQLYPAELAVADSLEELYLHRLPDGEARHIANQIAFYRVLLRLLELQEAQRAAGEPSMERSVAYLESRFHEKITSGKLAEIAGISRAHYSIRFRRLTGFSPNEYLSRLRLHRAQELLLGGVGTLRDIAARVGYKDEFYLSRRFKQQTGETPSAFVRRPIRRVAVLLIPYASHLLLLGLEPAVTLSESGEFVTGEELQPPQPMTFVSPNGPIEQVKAALIAGGIELIIAAGEHLDEYGLNAAQLRAAAPVAEIPWMELGWKEHLRLIARAIHRSDRAERWLAAFEREEREARTRVSRSAAAAETIAILVVKPDSLLVYGARNIGCVVYGSLGLTPPARIAEEIAKRGDRFHSVAIEPSELAAYAADRFLVVAYPDEKGFVAHAGRLFDSAYWNELQAVREGRVHHLDLHEWIPYNPYSIRLQLRRAVALLAGDR